VENSSLVFLDYVVLLIEFDIHDVFDSINELFNAVFSFKEWSALLLDYYYI
jgi:hypothetical protein